MDQEGYILSMHYWEEGKDSILDLFGTSMQHPEEKIVQYFGSPPVAVIEQGSPRHSPVIEQGSPRRSQRNIDSTVEGLPNLTKEKICP